MCLAALLVPVLFFAKIPFIMPLPELRIHTFLTAYRIKSKSLYLELKTLHYLTAYRVKSILSLLQQPPHCHIHTTNLFSNHKIQCEFYILGKAFPFPSSLNYSAPFSQFLINSITGHLIIYLLLPRFELSVIS